MDYSTVTSTATNSANFRDQCLMGYWYAVSFVREDKEEPEDVEHSEEVAWLRSQAPRVLDPSRTIPPAKPSPCRRMMPCNLFRQS